MGAHPSAPSGVERDGQHATLDALIAADPVGELGEDCARRFGGRLPFLLKVLAASKALSIQVHPSRAQAEAGYRCENLQGLAPGDKRRNYVDDWPKPEILCALTRFEVLVGMRNPADAARLLRTVGGPALAPFAAELDEAAGLDKAAETGVIDLTGVGGDHSRKVLASVLARILSWPEDGRRQLIDDVVAACERIVADDDDLRAADAAAVSNAQGRGSRGGPYSDACAAITRIAADHPGDLGIVASLLLRHAVLEPGQAIFLPAGGLHAYLRGTGIELLANSDNVVRAGLTSKHVDVRELLKLTDPAVAVPLIAPRDLGNGISVYDSPAPEFRLYRASVDASGVALPGDGPRLVLCVDGGLFLRDAAGATLRVGRGESCFLSAADQPVTAQGPAEAFIATVGTA
ncbi:MAG: mannose-6-phosphate isomerase, class [Actinomycetia bacterium]|nr:mannose-6-phosphate isomerase, class [Actinomycetes bacterium]